MKESFSELYSRLYRENFEELERLRKEEKRKSVGFIFVIIIFFLLASINPLFIFLGIVLVIVYFANVNKKNKVKSISNDDVNAQQRTKTYKEVFKEKIVGPIIENTFGTAKYNAKGGLSQHDYNKAGYKDGYDRFHSDDLIIAPLKMNDENTTFITFSEVHTERESRDSDGDRTYTTVFCGLAGSFLIPQDIQKRIYIRSNGRVTSWNKGKIKMDMSEFEKIFDVESDDPILTMRILTADVMTEMIELYQKYKYKFEISIINDTIHMRLMTGHMFEPGVFQSSMEYKQLEKYYLVLKALISLANNIYDTILRLEV